VLAFSLAASLVLLWMVDFAMGLRVDEEGEATGLDLSQHRERVGG
jgi:Amt family ammonium transporter